MENVGLFFLGRCTNPRCPLYEELTLLHIGCNRTFDFVKESKLCMCGACSQRIGPISRAVFVNCAWTYQGKLVVGEVDESDSEHYASPFEFFPAAKQIQEWDWLHFTVKSQDFSKPAKETQTVEIKPSSHSLESQTDFVMLALPEITPQLSGGVINNEVLDVMIQKVKRYKTKIQYLKRASGYKRPKYY